MNCDKKRVSANNLVVNFLIPKIQAIYLRLRRRHILYYICNQAIEQNINKWYKHHLCKYIYTYNLFRIFKSNLPCMVLPQYYCWFCISIDIKKLKKEKRKKGWTKTKIRKYFFICINCWSCVGRLSDKDIILEETSRRPAHCAR